MKECTKCKVFKPLQEFLYYKTRYSSYCRVCQKENVRRNYHKNKERFRQKYRQNKNYREKLKDTAKKRYHEVIKDGYHHVYLIPSDNYVGVSESLDTRISVHKHLGRDTTNYRVLYSTPDRAEALELEGLLHDLGYKGRHSHNMYR